MVWGEEVVKVWNGKFYRHEPTEALSGANPGSEKHLGQGTAVTWVRTVPWTSQVTTNTKVRAAARRQSSPTVAALWNYSGQYQLEEAEPPGATSQSSQERHTVLAAVSAEAEGCLLSHGRSLPVISDLVSPLVIFPENARVPRAVQVPQRLF